jgi:uncharacterized cupredoxin-like copper-binding protein
MQAHRIHPSALIVVVVVGLPLLALLAAACGGGNAGNPETTAAADTAEEMDGHDAAVATTPTDEHDEHDEAVDEHDDADGHDNELVTVAPEADRDEHDEAVDEHDDADGHDNELVTAAPEADLDEHDEAVDEHDDGDAHEADAAHMEIDEHDARTITVMASDFAFGPTEIHATVGETILLVLVNDGTVLHDITAVDFSGEASAVSTVEHEHADSAGIDFHTAADTGETTELLFVAAEAGEFKLFCTVPGHELLGMTGTLVIEEA